MNEQTKRVGSTEGFAHASRRGSLPHTIHEAWYATHSINAQKQTTHKSTRNISTHTFLTNMPSLTLKRLSHTASLSDPPVSADASFNAVFSFFSKCRSLALLLLLSLQQASTFSQLCRFINESDDSQKWCALTFTAQSHIYSSWSNQKKERGKKRKTFNG